MVAQRSYAAACLFSQSLAPSGQLRSLNWDGSEIIGASQELHSTTRLVHSYALGRHLGFAGSERIIEAGLRALREGHKDQTHGGYIWSFDAKGPCDAKKLAYGHVLCCWRLPALCKLDLTKLTT